MKAILVVDIPEEYMGSDIDVKLYGKNQTIHERYVNKLRPIDLDAIEEENPYKIIGKSETYSQYNEGWCDAIYRVRRELGL